MATIDVIMLSHNQTALTTACVRSLPLASQEHQVRLIWIDNGSGPAHRQAVVHEVSALGINCLEYYLPDNRGFPKAVNLGLALSAADYVVFLNDDVLFYDAVFDTMVRAIKNTEGAHLAATISTSGWQHYEQLKRRGWLAVKENGGVTITPTVQTPRVLERSEHPAFFCTMITRWCVQHIGYLTEAVGMGFGEDDDYNERIHAAGYKRLLCLDAFVYHHHRATWQSWKSRTEIRGMQQQSMDYLTEKYGERVW